MTHQYSRAERLLTRPFPTPPPKHSPKGKGRERDASQPLTTGVRLPMGPVGMIEVPEELQESVSRLVDLSVACRYLAAQCQVCIFNRQLQSLPASWTGSARKLGRGYGNVGRGKPIPGFRSAPGLNFFLQTRLYYL